MIELTLKNDAMTGGKIFIATGEPEDFKCSQCRKEINEGFMCENDKSLILCQACQDVFPMHKRCKFDKRGEHRHIKWEKKENGADAR